MHTWLLYLAAILGLSASPGPNGLLALTHGAVHGWRKTTFTVTGGVLGFVAVIAMSMFGIGALLQASATTLTVMKWLGGTYLVWLGIQVWRSQPVAAQRDTPQGEDSGRTMFLQGLLSAGTNPKVLLFFTAFLPGFIDPARGLVTQFCHCRHLRRHRIRHRDADRGHGPAHQRLAGARGTQVQSGVRCNHHDDRSDIAIEGLSYSTDRRLCQVKRMDGTCAACSVVHGRTTNSPSQPHSGR